MAWHKVQHVLGRRYVPRCFQIIRNLPWELAVRSPCLQLGAVSSLSSRALHSVALVSRFVHFEYTVLTTGPFGRLLQCGKCFVPCFLVLNTREMFCTVLWLLSSCPLALCLHPQAVLSLQLPIGHVTSNEWSQLWWKTPFQSVGSLRQPDDRFCCFGAEHQPLI